VETVGAGDTVKLPAPVGLVARDSEQGTRVVPLVPKLRDAAWRSWRLKREVTLRF
jgi:hypothetical protein